MMKRFYFSGDDDAEEEDDADSEAFHMPPPSEFIAMGQMESPFKHLMDCAIRICERTLVWRLLSPEDKVKSVRSVFDSLAEIEREYEGDAEIRDEM